MGHGPAHGAPGRDDDPGPERAGLGFDPRFDGDRGWRLRPSSPHWPAGEHPGELDDGEPPPEDEDPCAGWADPEDLDVWLDDAQMAALYAEAAQVTADAARAREVTGRLGLTAATAGVAAEDCRGPGMPGSARTYPGEYTSRASSFASGMPLDTAPGCVTLGLFADEAAGDDDRYPGASDDELAGVICGWDRDQAHAAARKYAAIAQFIRRRPAPGCALEGEAEMPAAWDEFAPAPGATSAPRFTLKPDSRDGPPGGYGTWRLSTGIPGRPDLIISIGPLTTDPCDHRHQARGHDPGVTLRHLTQIRNATCTGPGCRRPAAQCDFEHNVPYEAGGRSCLCNGDAKCRHDHRLKQHPGWKSEHLADGTIRWTMPSGRHYTTEPTRYPT
jgi:hypothetical protein